MLKTVFGLLVAFAVVFSDALQKMFDALIFVLVTHPYDLGDRVEIDGKYLYVESVGLWTTTFDGPGGLKTIMTNASLAHDKIANFRRSPAENEVFTYLVRPETVTEEAVESLREDCMQFFKEHNRDFLANWHLEISDQIDNERFKILVKIFHRHNFQNEAAKNERSQKFVLYFKDALIRNGFVFSPPMPKALATIL
jgi:small-conductance mechanosensitive channel